jgi:hypothetical protein
MPKNAFFQNSDDGILGEEPIRKQYPALDERPVSKRSCGYTTFILSFYKDYKNYLKEFFEVVFI